MNTIYYLIALVMLSLGMIIFTVGKSHAGGPWNDQYCDVEVTKIKIVDQQGQVVSNQTEEKVVCNDGAKDFLHGMGHRRQLPDIHLVYANGQQFYKTERHRLS